MKKVNQNTNTKNKTVIYILDYAHDLNIKTKSIAFNPESCSKVIKRRSFLKISYIVDDYHFSRGLDKNEKPSTST